MMKKYVTLALLALSLMATSCITTRSTARINKVEVGMTKEEITKLLGKPFFKNGDLLAEQWGYRKMIGEVAGPEEVFFYVTFDQEGRVMGYETITGRSRRHY